MADYTQLGYNQFLSKEDTSFSSMSALQSDPFSAVSAQQFSNPTSASNIQGGVMTSQDGKMIIDLVTGVFKVNDGTTDRIKLGLLDDNSTGLLIKDAQGNTLMQISGLTNMIQGSDGAMVMDFTNTQLVIKDSGGTPIILLGKQVGGF